MQIKQQVDKLSDHEARSLLLQMLLRTEMLHSGNYPEEDYMTSMNDIYQAVLTFDKAIPPLQGSNIHIVFSDSSAGSLKQAIKKLKINDIVITIPINFSIGPLWQLHQLGGLEKRRDWLFEHINLEDEFIFDYIPRIEESWMKLHALPEQCKIFIWGCENAHEQTGIAYAVYLLREKNNQIYIGLDQEHQQSLTRQDILHTGELAPEQWMEYIKNVGNYLLLSIDERQKWIELWVTLAQSKDVFLRTWEEGRLTPVSENYLDEMIIAKARELQKGKEFIKSARLIGEVIGHLDQPIGDLFIEYRLRTLAFLGVFELKGVPRAMRFYSVRLKPNE
ncbi:DUF1835 domain-containing protein [Cytobacillus kochii]|uniref:DUF1835 domain-containing protein n=1 Tax=Cytobacillus kochii TaxID=859143 RepID=UPI00203C74B0|nr:DUF1835 domain-containing protein [Cytobacillus kochii]MCM3323982.1 DUF1835 domain-containing protein [Cytobacillus kochii]MCM3346379.1 DUF1835 domain-containing protein [Cytobacillus kochii]